MYYFTWISLLTRALHNLQTPERFDINDFDFEYKLYTELFGRNVCAYRFPRRSHNSVAHKQPPDNSYAE